MPDWLEKELVSAAGSLIDGWAWLHGEASAVVVNEAVGTTRTRPHPFSTASDYTSWKSLTDRTYLARHLPACEQPADLPTVQEVTALFRRPATGAVLSRKSTCLFPAFAQYLTDGFLRTNPDHRDRTTSTHDIDLCPLYGRTPEQTAILRSGQGGHLRSQFIGEEEYPPFLFTRDGLQMEAAFAGLDPPAGINQQQVPPERLASLFAIGGDRANSTPFTAMLNTLLLREHNRIADELARQYGWDDERLFQTARNVVIAVFIKIVVEQYINHITPLPFSLKADPSVAYKAAWNRPNWMTVEFSLVYRWHSLLPDAIEWPGGVIPVGAFTLDNRPLLAVGLDAAFSAAAAQAAAELGAFNTADALLPFEALAIGQGRSNRVPPYAAYRPAFGLTKELRDFSDISTNDDVVEMLEELYETPDRVEFYAGLFAEDRVANSPLPELLLRMVAVDAFSQAYTNPLLSAHVFNEETFSPYGWGLLQETSNLGDVLARNVPRRGNGAIVMTQVGC